MKTLHVFGDSYSTPDFCVSPRESFWGLMTQELPVTRTINYSHSGFSFDQIMHIILNESFDFSNDYFVVGIPPIVRGSMFKERKDLIKQPAVSFDTDFNMTPKEVLSTDGVEQYDFVEMFSEEKTFMSNINHLWLEVMACNQIYLLHNFLKHKNAKFMIVNLTIPFTLDIHWPVSKNIMTKINELPECILFRDTFYSVNKDDKIRPVDRPGYPINYVGHHGPIGNANWYNKIVKKKMIELGWLE